MRCDCRCVFASLLGLSISMTFVAVAHGQGRQPGATVRGAQITYVQPSGAADEAGLQIGDIITAVHDRTIQSHTDLVNALRTRWARLTVLKAATGEYFLFDTYPRSGRLDVHVRIVSRGRPPADPRPAEEPATIIVHVPNANTTLMLDGNKAGRDATPAVVAALAQRMWVRAVLLDHERQPDDLSVDELEATLRTLRGS